ncbi:hypothetical protein AB0C96_35695 [Streptomyces sp. NPDC048506]|uniref:MmyB family transcriptional regulator n=1 Tax=Streptomyces sp. NPDC048506 TaxID=3155028 RepID=UPI003423B6A8
MDRGEARLPRSSPANPVLRSPDLHQRSDAPRCSENVMNHILGHREPGIPRPLPPITAGEMLRSHRIRLGYTSRESFAFQHGHSPRGYSDLETDNARMSMATMYALREQLRMGPVAKDQLFQLVTGAPPALKALEVDPALDRVTARWADAHVHTHQDPVVLMDGGWHTRHFNAAWAQIFDAIPPHPRDHPLDNPMRFLLFHPAAAQMFPDWEKWLVTAVTQVAWHYDLHPENPHLRDIRRRIAEDDFLEDLYVNRARQELTDHGTDAILQGDVDERPVLIDGKTMSILLTVMSPGHAQECGYQLFKLTLLGPYPGNVTPAPSRAPCPAAVDGPHDDHPAIITAPEQAVMPGPDRALTPGQLLRAYRERLGLPRHTVLRGAHLPVRTDRTLRKYEGDEAKPRSEYLPGLARVLTMSVWVAQYLDILVTRREPLPLGVNLPAEVTGRCARWAREHVTHQAAPTALMDGAWDVITCSSSFHELFRHVPADSLSHPTVNWLRYVAFHPDARVTLVDWYERWLIPALTDFGEVLTRYAHAVQPEQKALLDEFEADPLLWDAYTRRVGQVLQRAGAGVATRGDGAVRKLSVPSHGDAAGARTELSVRITTGVPLFGRPWGLRLGAFTIID